MKVYRKLKRTWTFNDINHIPKFKKIFPELKYISSEELANRFQELKMNFYYEEKTPIKWWLRLTLPFAIIFIILMFISLPIKFMITGIWGYELSNKNITYNWFKALFEW